MSARVGGGLSFAGRELKGLEEAVEHSSLVVLASRWNAAQLRRLDLRFRVIEVRVGSVPARIAYEQFVLPWRFRDSVLVYPGNFGPIAWGARRTCLTIQNPNYFGLGREVAWNRRWSRRAKTLLCYVSIRRAAQTVTISKALHRDVEDALPRLAGRLTCLPSGRPDPVVGRSTLYQDQLRRPFLLSVANDYRHKNLSKLVAVWVEARTRFGCSADLVLVGSVSESRRLQLLEIAGAEQEDLHFLGAVAEGEVIAWLYEEARLAVSLSCLEAHPLTPAEAGLYGTPLLLSDIAPHREVAGGHATYAGLDDSVPKIASMVADLCGSTDKSYWRPRTTWNGRGQALSAILLRLSGGAASSGDVRLGAEGVKHAS